MDITQLLDFLTKYDWLVVLFLAPLIWAVTRWIWEKLVTTPILQVWNKLTNIVKKRNTESKFLQEYSDSLINALSEIPPLGIPRAIVQTPIELEEVFTKVKLAHYRNEQDDLGLGNVNKIQNSYESFSLGTALRRYQKLVILGDPGTGKSTLVHWLVLTYARNLQTTKLLQMGEGLVSQKLGINETLLPIVIRVRSLNNEKISSAHELVRHTINPNLINRIPHRFFEKFLEDGKCLILIDGLDETKDLESRRAFLDAFQNLVAAYSRNRFIVTSRIVGYNDAPMSSGFFKLFLQPFEKGSIHEYINKWFTLVARGHLDSKSLSLINTKEARTASELCRIIDSHESLMSLAANPLLLTIITTLHWAGVKLPERRAELYSQVLHVLLGHWDEQKRVTLNSLDLSSEQKIHVLSHIAFHLQCAGKTEMPVNLLLDNLKMVLPFVGMEELQAKRFLQEIEFRSGVLIERGAGRYGFAHRSIQEFLAANRLRNMSEGSVILINNIDNPEWYEVILLYSGLGDSTKLIQSILNLPEDKLFSRLLLSAECTIQATSLEHNLRQEIENRLAQLAWPYPTDKWSSLWKRCLELLGRLNNSDIVKKISNDLHNDSNPEIRSLAVRALGYIKNVAFASDILESLEDEDDIVRTNAVRAMEVWNQPEFIEKLLNQLKEEKDSDLRWRIVRTLEEYDSPKAARALCELLQTHEEAEIRVHAAISLDRHSDDNAVIEVLTNSLKVDLHEEVRKWAASTLANLGGDEIGIQLAEALLLDTSESVREMIAHRLGEFAAPYSIDVLYDVLQNDEDDFVRMRAAASLAKIGDKRSYPYLYEFVSAKLLGNWAAGIGLEYVNTTKAVEVIVQTLKTTEDESLARTMVYALAALKPPNASELLTDVLLSHTEDIVRRDSAYAMGKLHDLRVKNAIVKAMKTDESTSVRMAAAYVISDLNLESCIDQLVTTLENDTQESVREAAAFSIGKLLGTNPLITGLLRHHS